MIIGIGIDIIELERIERAMLRNERFVDRILTKKEKERFEQLTEMNRKVEYVAGRFAAKEACAKAIGTGIGTVSFQHIEVLNDKMGAPTLTVTGKEAETFFISISHSKRYAVAQVIITSSP